MAHGKLIFENERTGQVKVAPVGYSWTTLFWGFFPALFRTDWKNFIIILAVHLGVALVTAGTMNVVVTVVFSFVYNKMMIMDLMNDSGWTLTRYEGTKSMEEAGRELGLQLERLVKV